ncbi:TPM domain-containing protein [Actinomyces faecalis]|uniref:TPM domain-containing protein n=1 Tax=Actinomyces faecalis TaxID=2722820 RepID=UPI001555747E|nr:TPM domain-containing protein [Actinomyces faecalis]
MHTTPSPRRPALAVLAGCGLILSSLLVTPVVAAAPARSQAPASSASAQVVQAASSALLSTRTSDAPSTTLSEQVTDAAGILTSSTARDAVATAEASNVHLWVVTYDDPSVLATDFAAKAWSRTGMGRDDVLLVINISTADPSGRSYAFDGDSRGSVWSQARLGEVRQRVQEHLSQEDWDGAVTTIVEEQPTAEESARSGRTPWVLLALIAMIVVMIGALLASARRRRGAGRRLGGKEVPTRSDHVGADPARTLPLEALRTHASSALLASDDAVRAADEELSYAQAQFGLSATDAFTQALAEAREHMERAFELRKLLDDDIPETEAQQRQMYGEMLQRCQQATTVIAAQEKAFHERRGIEANVPTAIAETRQRAAETEQALHAAQTLLVTLHATYPPAALSSVDHAPGQGLRLLAAGRSALEQAQASADSGQQATAVEQVRIAQGAVAQAGELAAQVRGARERLERAAQDLETAISSLSSDLMDAQRLAAQVPSSTLAPLVTEGEAAVAQARAALPAAEGVMLASSPATTSAGPEPLGSGGEDPLAALDRLARAEAALDAALAPARAKEENDSRARASLGSRLARLTSQIDAVTSYISTHRGAVGSSARTALSEAARHAAAATSLQSSDPTAALAEVTAGEPLVAQAQAIAEADVRDGGDSFGGSSRSGSSGLDLGSLVLGGILLGDLGGGHRDRSYGGWGGHRPGGSFGGGGGSFGSGGGGGFGGGGGRF